MPRFSIIVPSHGVAGRLSQALDSVLAQSFGDFELIPVCDAPDAPAADVVAGYAERDSRVTPVHSPPSAGLAGARNTGLRAAVGGHVLFLDGDDVLVPGALAVLDARLSAVGDVDVLHFEHERAPWWEGEPTNPAAPLLAQDAGRGLLPRPGPGADGRDAPGVERGLPPGLPHRAGHHLPRRPLHRHRLRRSGRPAAPSGWRCCGRSSSGICCAGRATGWASRASTTPSSSTRPSWC